jgi:autotransporter translocation and assembly factor TamB
MLKKISIITGATVAGLCLLLCITLVSALFYIESPQGSQRLQKTINDHIPGSLTWDTLKFSPARGTLQITDAALVSQENQPVVKFKRLFLSLDLAALFKRELVIKEFSINAPTVTIEKNKNNELNILTALVGAVPPAEAAPPEPDPPPIALPLNIIAKGIAITDGTFSFVSMTDAMEATIEKFSLKSQGNLEEMAANLTLSTGSIRINLPGVQTTIHTLDLSTAFLKDALTDLNLHLDADTANLDMTGSARTLFSTPEADIKVTLEGDIARTLMAVENNSQISGQIAARATVKGLLNNPDITLFLDYPGGDVLNQKINQANIDITMTNKICHIRKFFLDHDSGLISAKGSVDLSQAFPKGFMNPEKNLDALAWDIALEGKDLVPGTLLESFDIKGISGICQLNATFSGSMAAPPKGTLSFKAIGAGYQDYPRADTDIRLILDQGIVDIQRCKITSGSTDITLLGKVAVLEPGNMVPLESPRFNLKLNSTPIIIEEFTPYISALEAQGLKGKITLAANINGSKDLPKAMLNLMGQDIEVAGESIKRVDLTARLDPKKIYLEALKIALNETRKITATGWADLQHRFEINIKANDIRLSSFNHIKAKSPADGVFSCNLSGTGTFEDPRVQGDIFLTDLTVDGKRIQDFTANVVLQNQYADIKGKLNFDINAGFNLATRDFKGDLIFQKTSLTPWFQLAGQKDISGNVTGNIALKGNADHPDDITVKSTIKNLSIVVQEQFTIESTDMNAQLQGKAFQVSPFTTSLPGQGSITLEASGKVDGDITARAKARLPAKAAKLFADTIPDLEGEITLDVTALIKKEVKASQFNAKLNLNNLGLTIPDSQSKLHGINGTILADMGQVEIKGLKGFLDKGTFSITGKTSLIDFMPRAYTAKVSGKALPVNVPDGLNALFDVDLNLDGTMKKSALSGTILLDSGQLTKEININKEILSAIINPQRSRKGVKTEEKPNPYLENLTLDIFVQARNNFIVDLDLAKLAIHPDIRIQGSPLAPMVSGRSTIDPGTIQQYNKKFTLTRGIIDFINPYKIEPEIDIQALHEVRDWDITLSVTGTPDELIFSLTSDPELEQADITSLLLRGKTTNELISSEGGNTFSPENALAQFAASSLQDNMRTATGLDILEMGFDDPDSNGGVGSVNVTVGKKLTDRITVKYATASKDGQMVQTTSADYRVSDNISASGFQDSQGKFGGELKYRLEFE